MGGNHEDSRPITAEKGSPPAGTLYDGMMAPNLGAADGNFRQDNP